MLTPEGGGIAERPLTAGIRIISGVAGHQRCSAAAYDGESWGSGGKAPGNPGAGAVAPAGCGQSPRFCLVNKRKRHLQASLPLNPLYGNIAVKGRSAIPPKASPCEHMLTFSP